MSSTHRQQHQGTSHHRPPMLRWRMTCGALAIALLFAPNGTAWSEPAVIVAAPTSAQAESPLARSANKPLGQQKASLGGLASGDDKAAMAKFLDRLMQAESGGRDTARNPRSSALGAFQFIESTFIAVSRRHFAAETANLTTPQILLKRTDRAFARRAAEAYTRDNASALAANGLSPTYANLRLAYLLGATGAIRILQAPPQTPAVRVLGGAVVRANPFMAGMSARTLQAWAERNLAAADIANATVTADPSRRQGAGQPPAPRIKVRCNRGLASCQRWIALAKRRLARQTLAAGKSERRAGQ